jgi:hypothetical protein
LACCVPDLHFNVDAVDGYNFDLVVDSDGGDVAHLILVIDESQENIGLTHCTISDDHQFHHIVVFLVLTLPSHPYRTIPIII